ncbi:MAG: hypothetical protein RTV31_09445 [Candidatus Thorarchaeota archaeon]
MQTITTTSGMVPPTPDLVGGMTVLGTMFFFVIITGIVVYVLQRNIRSQKGPDLSSMKPSLTILITLLFIIAFFAPFNINIYPSDGFYSSIQIVGMSWQLTLTPYVDFMIDVAFLLMYLPFTFFRIVFVYAIYKYYHGKTTRTRVIIAGLLGELQLPLIGLAIIPIIISNPYLTLMFSIPIPILLIVGLLILKVVPRPLTDSSWAPSGESKEWWDKEKEETSVSDNA